MGDRSVAVIGLGYIGLPTAAILASHGYTVTGVDTDPVRVERVDAGEVPFVEPDLGDVLADAVRRGQLTATTVVPQADVFIIAVPTPFEADHQVDLSFINAAVDAILPRLRGRELIILESTSPPGTTAHVAARVAKARPELTEVEYAHAPERVLPGRVLAELVTNDRVIGGLTPEAGRRAGLLYASFCEGEIHFTDAQTAEMSKLAENAFRDINIAYANELSLICDSLGVDVWELIELANKHPRVNILQPGPGVGGHCIAVDPWFIVAAVGAQAPLIRTAREVNDAKPAWVVQQVREASRAFTDPVIAVLGLAFKPDIDDLRESPAMAITLDLPRSIPGARVLAVEPDSSAMPERLVGSGVEMADLDAALDQADVVVLLVDHTAFKAVDKTRLAGKPVIDTRGMWR